jgi:hypothetical protein
VRRVGFRSAGGTFQHAGFDHCSGTVGLADRSVECNLSVKGRARANHAVPAKHPGLDKLPSAEPTISEMIPLCGKYTRSIVFSALKMMVSIEIVTFLRCGKIKFRSVSHSDSKK